MSEPISGVAQGIAQQQQQQRSASREMSQPGGGQSFEQVLRGGGGNNFNAQQSANSQPLNNARVSGAELENMRVDLMNRVRNSPEGASRANILLPEFIDSKTRLGLLREAMNGVNNQPQGTDVRGQFASIEREWQQLDQVMRSDKDLSTGELLGLQARLYQVSQHVEVMSKVVDQVTGGVKTILNTNV